MRTVFVLFDSLNRLALGAYGGTSVPTPNFDRFSRRAATYDRHYVGSLPCMPARRDMHSGRVNFLHRSWGPLEPFDDSFPKLLSSRGVYTHLISDHLHYWEDGGSGYASAFDSWDFVRGQEYDAMKPVVAPDIARYRHQFDSRQYPLDRLPIGKTLTRRNTDAHAYKKSRAAITRDHLREEADYPIAECFARGFEFLELNREAEDWFLQLECFDPHEPFVVPDRFKAAYQSGYEGGVLDWPDYLLQNETPEEIAEIRGNYAALVAMCDEYFGRLLDYFDDKDLWRDTALVLTTDHGFLLGEHAFWGKNRTPYYEEIAHIPLMLWHPGLATGAGERVATLTQTPDLMPTFLELHGCEIPEDVRGRSLLDSTPNDRTVILGMFGGPVCITDGQYSYFRYPLDISGENLTLYTLMPSHMSRPFGLAELRDAELVPPFAFTKGVPVLRMRLDPANSQLGNDGLTLVQCGNALYDLEADPEQASPINDPEVEARLLAAMVAQFQAHDAPPELYDHFDLTIPHQKNAKQFAVGDAET